MTRVSYVVLMLFTANVHAGLIQPSTANASAPASSVEVANQNQQYHQERIKVESTKSANQNQQYHQERIKVESTKTANQNQQYHQERIKVESTKVANQNQQYYQDLLRILNTTKGKVADARLKKYLETYVASFDGKVSTDRDRATLDFGGCLIQRLYWNETYADAKRACAQAVPNVELAGIESCLGHEAKKAPRACVGDAVAGEIRRTAVATSVPRTKVADAAAGAVR